MAEKNMIKEYIGSSADKRVDIIMKNYTRFMLNAERKNDILGTPHKWIYKLFPVNVVLYLLITFYNIRTLSYYFNGEFELVIKIWSAISMIVPILVLITHVRERRRRKDQNTVRLR